MERDIKYYDTILQFGRKCGMTVYGKVWQDIEGYGWTHFVESD